MTDFGPGFVDGLAPEGVEPMPTPSAAVSRAESAPAVEAAEADLLGLLVEDDEAAAAPSEKKSKRDKKDKKKDKKDKRKEKKSKKKREREATPEDDDDEDEDDDDDEEEEDEDASDVDSFLASEDDEPRKKRRKHDKKKGSKREKKKRKQRKNKYIDDAASEGDESDEEGEAEEASPSELGEDQDTSYIDRHQQQKHLLHENEDNMDEDELARALEEKYAAQRRREKARKEAKASGKAIPSHLLGEGSDDGIDGIVGGSAGVEGSQRFAGDRLPKPTDPKVFAVKVRPGYARTLVSRMVNKCHAYLQGYNDEGVRQDLGIVSVFSVDHVKEWIYLEAHRRRFVEQALMGMEHVFRYRITQVDPKELMLLLSRQDAMLDDTLEVGQFVRIKFGPYKGDIGIVTGLLEEGKKATVRLVPREDFVGKAFSRITGKEAQAISKGSLAKRPQKFFTPQLALGARISESGDALWGDLSFDSDGYLLKAFSLRQLVFGRKLIQLPTLDELATFFRQNKRQIDDAARALKLNTTALGGKGMLDYELNDMVKVMQGGFANTVGRIIDLDRAKRLLSLEVRGEGGDLRTVTGVNFSGVVRHFSDGTHIIVERGKNTGDSGTVVCSFGENIMYCSDLTNRNVQVRSEDCRKGNVNHRTGSVRHGAYQLFQLVQLADMATVACITAIAPSSCTVLTTQDTTINVPYEGISNVIQGRRVQAIDRLGNAVGRDEAVYVDVHGVAPLYAGKRAKFLTTYGEMVFLQSGEVRANAGVFVVHSKQMMKLGGAKRANQGTARPRPVHVFERPPNPAALAVGFEKEKPSSALWSSSSQSATFATAYHDQQEEVANTIDE